MRSVTVLELRGVSMVKYANLLERVNADLDGLLATPGIINIAKRMVVAFGGEVADYSPYILAAVLEFNVANLNDIKDDPLSWVFSIEDKLPQAMAHAAVASERIGINWRERGIEHGLPWPDDSVDSISEWLAKETPVAREESTDDWPEN